MNNRWLEIRADLMKTMQIFDFEEKCVEAESWACYIENLENNEKVLDLALSRLYDLLNENRDNRYCSNCEFADILFSRCKNEGLYSDCKGNILKYIQEQAKDELKIR